MKAFRVLLYPIVVGDRQPDDPGIKAFVLTMGKDKWVHGDYNLIFSLSSEVKLAPMSLRF